MALLLTREIHDTKLICGYSYATDIWSLGATIFYMFTGNINMYGDCGEDSDGGVEVPAENNAEKVYKNVITGTPNTTAIEIIEVRKFVEQCFTKNQHERINQFSGIRNHEMFLNINWQGMLDRQAKAPTHPMDVFRPHRRQLDPLTSLPNFEWKAPTLDKSFGLDERENSQEKIRSLLTDCIYDLVNAVLLQTIDEFSNLNEIN